MRKRSSGSRPNGPAELKTDHSHAFSMRNGRLESWLLSYSQLANFKCANFSTICDLVTLLRQRPSPQLHPLKALRKLQEESDQGQEVPTDPNVFFSASAQSQSFAEPDGAAPATQAAKRVLDSKTVISPTSWQSRRLGQSRKDIGQSVGAQWPWGVLRTLKTSNCRRLFSSWGLAPRRDQC